MTTSQRKNARLILGIVLALCSLGCLSIMYSCFMDIIDNDVKWFLTIFLSFVALLGASYTADKIAP